MVGAPYDRCIAWWVHHIVGAPFGRFAVCQVQRGGYWRWVTFQLLPSAGVKEGTRKLSILTSGF